MSDHATPPMIGVLGGSGLYEIEGLEEPRWEAVRTPFGDPSDEILRGRGRDGIPTAPRAWTSDSTV
mgnify:CR=1 FL=1